MQTFRSFATALIALAALPASLPVLAAEPTGCDHFKWPLDHEKTLLATPAPIATGDAGKLGNGENLKLVPQANAKLPQEPSRPPKFPDSYAGFVTLPAPASAGSYRVTIAHGAWIDVVQDGHVLKSTDHTGAIGCDGLAKSVKFDLAATPFTVEISSSTEPSVTLVVTPN
ncbi:MAG: hypothetical protein WDN02_02440 [Methylovirgula sp.]|uniref:hypothetical protein n=1 Tax=Methylovirgula sp. TaxID=1978224 RepID=UPI0030760539